MTSRPRARAAWRRGREQHGESAIRLGPVRDRRHKARERAGRLLSRGCCALHFARSSERSGLVSSRGVRSPQDRLGAPRFMIVRLDLARHSGRARPSSAAANACRSPPYHVVGISEPGVSVRSPSATAKSSSRWRSSPSSVPQAVLVRVTGNVGDRLPASAAAIRAPFRRWPFQTCDRSRISSMRGPAGAFERRFSPCSAGWPSRSPPRGSTRRWRSPSASVP